MKRSFISTAAMVLAFGAVANASGPGTNGSLAVTGEVDASVGMFFHQHTLGGGITLDTGDGSANPTASLAEVSKFGTPDGVILDGGNFTKSTQSDGFTLTGVVDVQVFKANSTSSNYTLNATLLTADNLVWTLNTNSVANGSQTQLTNAGSYGSTRFPITIAIKIPNTVSAGSEGNTIVLTVTCN
ncbi:MAG TPA: hypothetical protein VG096_02840 [Bryobacteraceae bacterium]|jgi:hypothetical protein|nr:hypothetical protein [Bryobacteraceae bacterium]